MRISDLKNMFNRSFALGVATTTVVVLVAHFAMRFYRPTNNPPSKKRRITGKRTNRNHEQTQPVAEPSQGDKQTQPVAEPSQGDKQTQPVAEPSQGDKQTQPVTKPSQGDKQTQPVTKPSQGDEQTQPVTKLNLASVNKLKDLIKKPDNQDFEQIISDASRIDLQEAIKTIESIPKSFTGKLMTLSIPNIEKKFATLCNQWPSLIKNVDKTLKMAAFPYITNSKTLENYGYVHEKTVRAALKKIDNPTQQAIWLKSLAKVSYFTQVVRNITMNSLSYHEHDPSLYGKSSLKDYLKVLSATWEPVDPYYCSIRDRIKWIPFLLKTEGSNFLKKVRLSSIVYAAKYVKDKPAYLGIWFNKKISLYTNADLKNLKLTVEIIKSLAEMAISTQSIKRLFHGVSLSQKLEHKQNIIKCCRKRPEIEQMFNKVLNEQLKRELNDLDTKQKKIQFLEKLSNEQLLIVYENKHTAAFEGLLEKQKLDKWVLYDNRATIGLLAKDRSAALKKWVEKVITSYSDLKTLEEIELCLTVKDLSLVLVKKMLNAKSPSYKIKHRKKILEHAVGHEQITEIKSILNETTLKTQLKEAFNTSKSKEDFLKNLPDEQLVIVYKIQQQTLFEDLFRLCNQDNKYRRATTVLKVLPSDGRVKLLLSIEKSDYGLHHYLSTLATQSEFKKLEAKICHDILWYLMRRKVNVSDGWLEAFALELPKMLQDAIDYNEKRDKELKERLRKIQKEKNLTFDQSLADFLGT